MRSSELSGECPQNPTERTCGLAAACWLVQNEVIYIDAEPTNSVDRAYEASVDATPGVMWDDATTGGILELVDQAGVNDTSVGFACATFGCKACSNWVRVSLEPFDTFGVDIVNPLQ